MRVLFTFVVIVLLSACKTSPPSEPAPYFSDDIITISQAELSKYWLAGNSEPKTLARKPEWIPKGAGQWEYDLVIDSNGRVVERILLSSQPEGYMTQERLDQMPGLTYTPAPENEIRRPVRVTLVGKILPRSQL